MDDGRSVAFHAAREHFRKRVNEALSSGRSLQGSSTSSSSSSHSHSHSYSHSYSHSHSHSPPGDSDFYRPMQFLHNGAAKRILDARSLRKRVLGKVIHPNAGPDQEALDLAKIHGPPGLCSILLNILTLDTPDSIPSFETYFLAERPCGKTDVDLPFDEHLSRQLFGDSLGVRFFNRQFAFVAVTLGTGLFHREYQTSRCLPYLDRDEHIGSGAYGKVYRVKIEAGHFLYQEPASTNQNPVLLARKDFGLDPESYKAFEDEDRTLRKFVNASNCPSNIMTSICSIVCTLPGTDAKLASIFFPAAMCDLNKYMKNSWNKPEAHTGRLLHMRQMLGVCQALEWLAKNLSYKEDSDTFIHNTYHHCDLKPDNILVCQNQSADGDALIFKISDFGKARELQHVLQGERNQRMQQPALGIDLPTRRESTYRAPEIQGRYAEDEVRPESDVWSFGCILLLVIVFNYHGTTAIDRFCEARRESSPRQDEDRFCNPEAKRNNDIRNAAVTKHLDALIRSREGQLEIDDTIALESLKYLKESILVRYNRRHNITSVSQHLHSIYNHRTPVAPTTISHWNVPSDATHCGHSPDGMVFFYSPRKIVLYGDSRSSDPREIRPPPTVSKWSGSVKPRSSSCAEEAICVVSESSHYFECIFYYTRTHGLQEVHLRDIKTSVERVAFSPDGSMLAIACSPSNNHQARVQLYRSEDIRRAGNAGDGAVLTGSTSSSVTESTLTSDPPDLLHRDGIGRVRSVGLIVDLCFSGDSNTLYYACRLANTRTPRVRVIMWSMESRYLINDCIIKDEDTTYPDLFLTSIVPLNTRVGFICVTHQRAIVKYENRMQEGPIVVQGVKHLRSVLISSDDEKVVMLATPDGSHVEIYGGPLRDLTMTKKLDISTRIRFDEKRDSAYLREGTHGMQLCLTSLRERSSYTVDLGRLFDF